MVGVIRIGMAVAILALPVAAWAQPTGAEAYYREVVRQLDQIEVAVQQRMGQIDVVRGE